MTRRIQKSQLTPKDNTDAARDDDEIAESEPNAGPFFIPITSAIAIRDRTSLRQATILTDRPSLATAEYHNATIEIVHLSNHVGTTKSNAKYYLQIFNRFKGASKQRDEQIMSQA